MLVLAKDCLQCVPGQRNFQGCEIGCFMFFSFQVTKEKRVFCFSFVRFE